MNVDSCSDDEWDAFVAESPHGSVFAATWFLDALGLKRELVVVRDGGRIVVGVPILFEGEHPVHQPYDFTMYLGPIAAGEITTQSSHRRIPVIMRAVEVLLAALEGRFNQISFSFHHAWDDLRSFSWFNYHTPQNGCFSFTPRYTALLALSDVAEEDRWLASVRRSRRRDIEKARSNGFQCELTDNIDVLVKLYVAMFDRQDISIDGHKLEMIRHIAHQALSVRRGFIVVCRNKESDAVSANLIVHDQHTAFNLIGGTDPANRSAGAATLILIDCIQRCYKLGLSSFDFVGINSPGRGDFKVSFNGYPKLYLEAAWHRS